MPHDRLIHKLPLTSTLLVLQQSESNRQGRGSTVAVNPTFGLNSPTSDHHSHHHHDSTNTNTNNEDEDKEDETTARERAFLHRDVGDRFIDVDVGPGFKQESVEWRNELPCRSIYAIAPFVTATFEFGPDDCWTAWPVAVELWIGALIAIALQAGAVYYVADIVADADAECSASSEYLQLIALFVFSSRILTDLVETAQLLLYLEWVPVVPSWQCGLHVISRDKVTGQPRDYGRTEGSGVPRWYKVRTSLSCGRVVILVS